MTEIEPEDAMRMAKDYVVSLFEEEQIRDVAVVERKFDPDSRMWQITVGFARPWDNGRSAKYPFDEQGNLGRSFKAVQFHDETGRIELLKDRFLVDSWMVSA